MNLWWKPYNFDSAQNLITLGSMLSASNKCINHMRDFTLYKIALSDSEIAQVMRQQKHLEIFSFIRIGDVKVQKVQMVRYYKFQRQMNAAIQYDYSLLARHSRQYFLTTFWSDDDMSLQIQEAMMDQPSLYQVLTNKGTNAISIGRPLYPITFRQLNFEFWVRLHVNPGSTKYTLIQDEDPNPQNFQIIADTSASIKLALYSSTFLNTGDSVFLSTVANIYLNTIVWKHIYVDIVIPRKRVRAGIHFNQIEKTLTSWPYRYWKLKPLHNKKILEDTSINPQFMQQSELLEYISDSTYPVSYFILADHYAAMVSIANSVTLKVYNKQTNQYQATYASNVMGSWNHFLFYRQISGSNDVIDEFRVWKDGTSSVSILIKKIFQIDITNYMHVYKQKIYDPYDLEGNLVDYFRFTKYSSDPEYYKRYAYRSSGIYPININQALAITTVQLKQTENLQECELGYYFNGIICKADSAILKALNAPSLLFAQFNSSTQTNDNYHLGFYFRLSQKMFSNTGQDLDLINSYPSTPSQFFRMRVDVSTKIIVTIGGQDFIYEIPTLTHLQIGWWYYCVDFSQNHYIYIGKQDVTGFTNYDPDFAIRDFFISYGEEIQFSKNQASYHPRNRWSIQSSGSLFVWNWDQLVVLICQGPFEAYHQHHQYYCGKDLAAGSMSTITQSSQFTLTMNVNIKAVISNSLKSLIFVLNPTSTNDYIRLGIKHQYIGNSYQAQVELYLHGFTNTISGTNDQICNFLVGAWRGLSMIKDGNTYKIVCNYLTMSTQNVPSTYFPFQFDDKIEIGGTRGSYKESFMQIRDFAFYSETALTQQQLDSNYLNFTIPTRSYFALDINFKLDFEFVMKEMLEIKLAISTHLLAIQILFLQWQQIMSSTQEYFGQAQLQVCIVQQKGNYTSNYQSLRKIQYVYKLSTWDKIVQITQQQCSSQRCQNMARSYANQFFSIKPGKKENKYISPTYSFAKTEKYCEATQVFDGVSCQSYKYLHLETNSYIGLKFANPSILTTEATVEFWILFQKNQEAGQIIRLTDQILNDVRLEEDSSYNTNLQTINQVKSYWRKIVLTLESVSISSTLFTAYLGLNEVWKYLHQISQYAEHLFVVTDSVQVYDDFSQQIKLQTVPVARFFPKLNGNVELKGDNMKNNIQTWSVEFWLKFVFKAGSITNIKLEIKLIFLLQKIQIFTKNSPKEYIIISQQQILTLNCLADDIDMYFQMKNLKFWSKALPLDAMMYLSMLSQPTNGYSDLIMYYTLDNEYFIEMELARRFYDVGSGFKWDIADFLQSQIKEKEMSFTLFVSTFQEIQDTLNHNIIKLGNIFQLMTSYGYQVYNFDQTNGQKVSLSNVLSGSSRTQNWFITFDLENKKIQIILDDVLLEELNFSKDSILKYSEVNDWQVQLASTGVSDDFPKLAIRQLSIFHPPLTYQQTKMISQQKLTNQYKGTYDMIEGVRMDHNKMVFGKISGSNFFDLKENQYIVPIIGSQIDVEIEGNCAYGAYKVGRICVEQANLVLAGKTLSLSIAGAQIGTSFTCQGWFLVKQFDSSSVITFLEIVGVFKLIYDANVLYLTDYSITKDVADFQFSVDIWMHLSVIMKGSIWVVYQNAKVIGEFNVFKNQLFNKVLTDLNIGTQNLKSMLKIKEIALFGHARDPTEIRIDMFNQISRVNYQYQLLAYYPLSETSYQLFTDLSTFNRFVDLGTQTQVGIFWDYQSRDGLSSQNTKYDSNQLYSPAIQQDKTLFFPQTTPTVDYTLGEFKLGTEFSMSFLINVYDPSVIISSNFLMRFQANLFRMSVQSGKIVSYFSDDAVGLFLPVLNPNAWQGCAQGVSYNLKSGYNMIFVNNAPSGDLKRGTFIVSHLLPSVRQIIVQGLNLKIRDIRIYSELLDPFTHQKFIRQGIYPSLTVYPCVFMIRITDGFGLKLYEQVSNSLIQIQTSVAGNWQYWQTSTDVIYCDGFSKYQRGSFYCQKSEKFLRLVSGASFSFQILKNEMQNSTLMIWTLVQDFGTEINALRFKLQNRFEFILQNNTRSHLYIANNTYLAVNNRDDSKFVKEGQWFLVYNRIGLPGDIINNYIGIPAYINDTFSQIQFRGSKITNVKLEFAPNSGGLTFQINTGVNSKIYFRNMQLWSTAFSIQIAERRALRGPNPLRFKDSLVALYRFDEAKGSYLYNTAAFEQEISNRIYYDDALAYIDWTHYSQIGVDQSTDSEDQRNFLFCLEPNMR
ncbi:UNKNOWN [Stylonychia lemnae]|uniref:Uncharacterized protein n=1 Tax=Stylonychia lemnae TaxID=5949 RepID=A0A078A155_STYLE|nr:UNKNOWN [Stylonychia lemnae]|eukprot:CDW75218.1 UNKNOWN [Stylonychia lemnae]